MEREEFDKTLNAVPERQKSVLLQIMAGKTYQEISNSLKMKENTIRVHVSELYKAFKIVKTEDSLQREQLITLCQKYMPMTSIYIERPPLEEETLKALLKPGALLRLKAPHKFGKTLLLERMRCRVTQEGYRSLVVSFTSSDPTSFTDIQSFSKWFCLAVGKELGVEDKLEHYWKEQYGCNANISEYFEEYLLAQLSTPLMLALDTFDHVFEHKEIATSFCQLLRGWHEKARRNDRTSPIWRQLRLAIVHSTDIYGSLAVNCSPLGNVGLTLKLPEFTMDQVQELARHHKLDWASTQAEQLMDVVGGHPYLVHLAVEAIARDQNTLEQVLAEAATEGGIYRDHLREKLGNLKQSPELARAFGQVVRSSLPIELDPVPAFKLDSMGLVNISGKNVSPRCSLYGQYFCNHLLE